MRKNIFERLGVPHVEKDDDARKQRVFTSGHIFHQWIQEITKQTGLSIAQELELQDEDLMIRGHIDDLVLIKFVPKEGITEHDHGIVTYPPELIESRLILYDYKTQNSRAFTYQKGRPISYYHKMQLGTYMYMLRTGVYGDKDYISKGINSVSEARILKIEKDTLMMMEQQLLWDTQLESDVLAYWNSLNAHWKAKTLPKCSCADHDNGFMASEKYNPYFFEGEPCSAKYYERWKSEKATA